MINTGVAQSAQDGDANADAEGDVQMDNANEEEEAAIFARMFEE